MKKFLLVLFQPYKWLIALPLFLIFTVLLALVMVFLTVVAPNKAHIPGVIWSRLTQLILFVRLRVRGRENIEKGTSYVVMPNHQSGFDIIAVYCAINLVFKWIMKIELRKVPVIGWACEKGKFIFINRSSAREAYRSLQRAKQILTDGTSVMVFPEGTRNYSNELTRFKSGGFKLAQQLSLPILPITILDTHKVMGRNPLSFAGLCPATVEVVIHKPIATAQFAGQQSDLMDTVKASIADV